LSASLHPSKSSSQNNLQLWTVVIYLALTWMYLSSSSRVSRPITWHLFPIWTVSSLRGMDELERYLCKNRRRSLFEGNGNTMRSYFTCAIGLTK
jgi:hypothetical protein